MALMSVVTVCALLYLEYYQNLYQGLILGHTSSAAWSLALQIVIGTILIVLALLLLRKGIGNVQEARGRRPAATDGGVEE